LIRLRFFAGLKEIFGEVVEIDVDATITLNDLLKLLEDRHGIESRIYMAAVDGKLVNRSDFSYTRIGDDTEVRLYPPVGGG